MNTKISVSTLSADFSTMGETLKKLETCGTDMIHFDVMDGSFVGPITYGGQMVKNLRPLSKLPFDVHLMIEHPQTQIKFFADAGADIITVHYGACAKISESYLKDTLELIKSYGVKCGVAVNPDVPVENIFPVFGLADMVLLMTVFPGYGGQKFIPEVLDKIKKAREYALSIGKGDMDIEVDGGVCPENSAQIRKAGANVLVAGTSVLNSDNWAATISKLRQ
ncbi:MAG: ribulose-phosphate 3-epimerase [Clostridia bacterium]|nr:ribulose-phosphate 3-epimerase [Clostridia bacterium]